MEIEPIKCAMIVSDDSVRRKFEEFIHRMPNLSYEGSCASVESALQLYYKNKIQLFFINIEKGMSTYQLLKVLNPVPFIIFISDTDRWAIDSYKLDAVDYLLMQSTFAVFMSAVIKVFRLKNSSAMVNLAEPVHSDTETVDFICIKSEYQLYRINISDLYLVEALGDYVKIFISGLSKPLLSLLKISDMEQMLPEAEFMRVHRSFIVQKKAITEISPENIQVNDRTVPVGNTYRNAVKDFVNQLVVLDS